MRLEFRTATGVPQRNLGIPAEALKARIRQSIAQNRHRAIQQGESMNYPWNAVRADSLSSGALRGVRRWDHPAGFSRKKHMHAPAQLLLPISGAILCEAEGAAWVVPAGVAFWIPPGAEHGSKTLAKAQVCSVYLDPREMADPPEACCILTVSNLLRELVIALAESPPQERRSAFGKRLVDAMLDQLSVAPREHLRLPMPADSRLRRIAHALRDDPSDRTGVADWARRIGVSERTLARLMLRETAMGFVQWRRTLHVLMAISRLASGESVQVVAEQLGYETTSAFSTMFRKVVGKPPTQYLAGRRRRPASAKAVIDPERPLREWPADCFLTA
ncbi:MAG: helix-turn-helix domain-containing protein [Hyphomonadaceae bacterium]